MSQRYSIWSLLKHAMGGHKGWERAWRDPERKKSYVVIFSGGVDVDILPSRASKGHCVTRTAGIAALPPLSRKKTGV